jgi:hypothetical protein
VSNDGKDNEARDGGPAESGVPAGGAHSNGASRVPSARFYPRAVRIQLGEHLESLGAELRRLGDTLGETGRLLPTIDESGAANAIGDLRTEIRHLRDMLTHLGIMI